MNLAPILNAFPKKTRVTFIHAETGKVICIHKMKPEQLPISFIKPSYIEVEGTAWRVMKAEPVHAKEFTIDNKLILHVQEPASVDPDTVGVDVPTICIDCPELTIEPLFTDFVLDISKDRWRQLELLPAMLLPSIQEEMLKIESILFPGEGINTLRGYKNIHLRKHMLQEPISISFEEFCARIPVLEKGSLSFQGNKFIQNGFVLRSYSYLYYGMLKDGMIEELCLEQFDSVDEEFYQVGEAYDLVLADWCNGKIIMA